MKTLIPYEKKRNLSFFSFLMLLSVSVFAQKTSVRGRITDAKTGETMPYVNLQFDGTAIGVTSDVDGNFYLETTTAVSKLKVTYVGYKNQFVPLKPNTLNQVTVKLEEGSNDLQEVVVKVEKYRNKGNPAVELIKKVIENKDKNRKEGFDFYSYEKYDKVDFAINNVTDKMRNNFIFRNIKFAMENVDTNRATGKVNWPIFIREQVADVYYSKDKNQKKERVRGERNTTFADFMNSFGISNYVNNIYQDVDFYENAVELLTVQFVSPLNPIAPNIYRFYIQDTSILDGTPMAHLYFAPRNKTDLAFQGHLWVALDSTYAVRKIEAGVPKDININYVRELQLIQEYDWVATPPQYLVEKMNDSTQKTRGLMLTKDEIIIDLALSDGDSTRSMLGKRKSSYKNYQLNTPLPDSLFFTGGQVLYDGDAYKKTDVYWSEKRHEELTQREKGIYKTVDTLRNYRPFKNFFKVVRILFEGYAAAGPIDIGPTNTFYSFNTIEGLRLRVGGRTNAKFSEKMMLEGYGAYGFRDEKFKGFANLRYNLGNGELNRFPYNQLRLWYQDDIRIPGQDLAFVSEDNFLLSFKRGVNDKMLYTRTVGAEYFKEYRTGFAYTFALRNVQQTPAGALKFDYLSRSNAADRTDTLYKPFITSSEINVMLRYAPNEKFYEGGTYRVPIVTRFPIFELYYDAGFKGIGESDYNYHQIRFKAEKYFFIAPFGIANVIVEGGRTFGQVPYPLLTIHRANQTYAYQMENYNFMNFLEFASDKYASINIVQNFGGILFNRIPLLKKLKFREVVTFKALWGGIDAQNMPNADNQLLQFPTDAAGNPLTFALQPNKPYIETGVGIANIFKVLRFDYIWRLNYNENPNVQRSGLRVRIKFDF